jgi:hypothetical protein
MSKQNEQKEREKKLTAGQPGLNTRGSREKKNVGASATT